MSATNALKDDLEKALSTGATILERKNITKLQESEGGRGHEQ